MGQEQKDRELFYHTLSRQIMIWVMAVSFIPMIVVSSILLYQFHISFDEKYYAHLEELLQKHKQKIDAFLTDKLGNIKFLVADNTIDDLTDESFLQEKLNIFQNAYGSVFIDLGVVSSDGVQVAYAGPFKLVKADYAEAEWFKLAIKREYFVSDVFLGLRGHPHFIVAVKVNRGGRQWVVRATINFTAFNSLVENIQLGKTGFGFILNKHGAFQTKPRFNIAPERVTLFLNQKIDDREGITIISQSKELGKKYIYFTAFLNNEEWQLVYRQDTADAFSGFRRTLQVAAIFFLLGSFSIVTLAYILPKKIVKLIAFADKKSEMMNQQVIETGKLASLGELAAGIAHEINNPVAIMVEEAGWIGDLLEDEDLKEAENLEEFVRALAQINTQGKRCKEITHKLLSFARKTDSRVRDVQINDLIEEIVSLSSQMAKYNNVTINQELCQTLPFLRISPSEMQQVLLNLINNAIYVMEKRGGQIIIASKISQLEKSHVVITIEDDGPGIPEANLSRIFDPFFTTKPVGKGTGLGLSIVYGIIQKMGGKIDVQSAVDVGTRFRIWLPFDESDGESEPPVKKVLAKDDNI